MAKQRNPKNNPPSSPSVEDEILGSSSIEELLDILNKTRNTPISKEDINAIIQKMFEWIRHDDHLNLSLAALNLLKITNEYCAANQIAYPNFDDDVGKFLKNYLFKMKQNITQSEDGSSTQVEKFFYLFDHNPIIENLKNKSKDTGIKLLNKRSHIHSIIKEIEDLHTQYQKTLKKHEAFFRQRIYSNLLVDILEGRKSTESVLPILESQKSDLQYSRELLPDTEYPVPNAEPEHPDYIGFNRTMDFNPKIANKISELFCTKELQKDYINAFPWGITFDTAERLEFAYFDPDFDLINTNVSLSVDLQFVIMSYTLLCLDAISKLAGTNGELSLENLRHIRKITESLDKISDLTNDPKHFDYETTTNYVLSLLYKLYKQNQQLEKYLNANNPPFEVQANPEMNGFCHLNEHLITILCGKEYQQSALSPSVPDPNYQNVISQYINFTSLKKHESESKNEQKITETANLDTNKPQSADLKDDSRKSTSTEIKTKHFENRVKKLKKVPPPMIKRSIEQVRKKLRSQ